jgi:hypothetical protein
VATLKAWWSSSVNVFGEQRAVSRRLRFEFSRTGELAGEIMASVHAKRCSSILLAGLILSRNMGVVFFKSFA